jgi:hypothetical protein
MVFDIWAGMLAGFLGTLAMMATTRAATAAGMVQMPPMLLIQGAMATGDPEKARRIGVFTHVVVMGTLVFGLLYAAIFAALGTAGWLTGLTIGLVHGVVSGVLMRMMGAAHPRMEAVSHFAGDETWHREADGLHIAEPGFFGANYGKTTPVGFLMGHAVFGLVVGLVYTLVV